MAWLVLSIIMALAFAACLVAFIATKPDKNAEPGFDKPGTTWVWAVITGLAILVCWIVLTPFFMVHQVGEREVGVVYNFSGTIAGSTEPGGGVVWTTPWQSIKKENIAIRNLVFELNENNSAVTSDQQSITARLAVNIQVDPEKVEELYSRVGPNWEDVLLEARVLQDFKEITSTFTTPQLTAERDRLRSETKTRLVRELEPYSVSVVDVFVKNLGFSEGYTKAIDQKVIQQQATAREQEKTRQIEEQNKQVKSKADAEAYANRVKARAITPGLLQLKAIETLNPRATLIVCPPRTVCVPNNLTVQQVQAEAETP